MNNLFYSTQENILCLVDTTYESRNVNELISSLTSKSNELARLVNTNQNRVITSLLTKGRHVGCRAYFIKNVTCPDSAYIIPKEISLTEWLDLSFERFFCLVVHTTL